MKKGKVEIGILQLRYLNGTSAIDSDLLLLQAIKSLHSFDLSMSFITDEGLLTLSSMRHLNMRKLNLLGCEEITDAGMAHVGRITSLRSLSLYGNIKITVFYFIHVSLLLRTKALRTSPLYQT